MKVIIQQSAITQYIDHSKSLPSNLFHLFYDACAANIVYNDYTHQWMMKSQIATVLKIC